MAAGHDFHLLALVESSAHVRALASSAKSEPATAKIIRFLPERIELESRASEPGLLVLAEPWYPGWTAAIDGKPAEVFPVNAWMRGGEVTAGEHRVVFEFRPRSLQLGAIITALALGVLAWIALRAPRHTATA